MLGILLERLRQEDYHKFQASLGFIVRPCLKIPNESGVVEQYLSTWEDQEFKVLLGY